MILLKFFYYNNFIIYEFMLQLIIIYNSYQIVKQINFYYLISYFTLNVLYLGIFLILYDFDLNASILWIIYGGIIIIFFLFSFIWVDIFKNYYSFFKIRGQIYIYIIIFLSLLIYFFSLKYLKLDYFFNNTFYLNYYRLNIKNKVKELELMGLGLIYYLLFFIFFISYLLFLNCIIITVVIINSKKVRNEIINIYYVYILKQNKIISFNTVKNQLFYIQESDMVYQKHTFLKSFKVLNYFHSIKNINRRV